MTVNIYFLSTFDFASGSSHDEQQVGNLWSGENLLSVALSGEIRYLDKNTGKVSRGIHGHSKATTSLTSTRDDTLFTGSYDGRVCAWPYGTDQDRTLPQPMKGDQHTNQITSMVAQGDSLFSAGMDDVVRIAKTTDHSYTGSSVSVGALPKTVSVSNDDILVVSTTANVQIYDKQQKKIGQVDALGFTPTAAGINANGKFIVVGGEVSYISTCGGLGCVVKQTLSRIKLSSEAVWSPQCTDITCLGWKIKSLQA
jgi:WD40 repeat protein